MFNIPNILTLLRLVLIPVFMVVFFWKFQYHEWITAGLFLLAAITDWLDGFLARYLNQTSRLGAFMDPVVDKLMIAAALVLLVYQFPNAWVAVASIVIVSREILISALREWMAEIGKRATVKVSYIGKVKTAMQMLAILILLAQPPGMTYWVMFGIFLMYIAVALTLWSMMIYLMAAWKELRAEV